MMFALPRRLLSTCPRLDKLSPSPRSDSTSQLCHLFHQSCVDFTQQTSAPDFHSVLSEENKKRSQAKLSQVDPVRTWKDYKLKPNHKSAAVLVPLCVVDGEPSLLFTLRSSKLKSHGRQVSYPGGNADKADADATHTALRETHEELGLDPATIHVWGELRPHVGKVLVHPILANLGHLELSRLRVNPEEVEEAMAVSLRHLCQPGNAGSTRFRDGDMTLPVFPNTPHRIWGLTAIITHMTLKIIAPEFYHHQVQHVKTKSFPQPGR